MLKIPRLHFSESTARDRLLQQQLTKLWNNPIKDLIWCVTLIWSLYYVHNLVLFPPSSGFPEFFGNGYYWEEEMVRLLAKIISTFSDYIVVLPSTFDMSESCIRENFDVWEFLAKMFFRNFDRFENATELKFNPQISLLCFHAKSPYTRSYLSKVARFRRKPRFCDLVVCIGEFSAVGKFLAT